MARRRLEATQRAARLAMVVAVGILTGPRAEAQTLSVSAPPALDWAATRVETLDTRALAASLARAGLEAPQAVHVTLVPDDDARAASWPRWVLAFADPPAGITIFPERSARYPYDSLEGVVRHEVAHLALARRAGNRELPRWFHEGAAVSLEGGFGLADRARLIGVLVSGPAITDVDRLFASGREAESARAYRLAAALVADLRRRHGADVVGRIAGEVARGVTFEQAFESTTSETTRDAAAAAWGRYLRWTRWMLALDGLVSTWTLAVVLALAAFVAQRRRRARRRKQWDEDDGALG